MNPPCSRWIKTRGGGRVQCGKGRNTRLTGMHQLAAFDRYCLEHEVEELERRRANN